MARPENRYYKDSEVVPDEFAVLSMIKKEKTMSLEYEGVSIDGTQEGVKKIELKEKYGRAVAAESA
ncbi:hypothetical protein [Methanocella conradii]|uniref:hypothetical protein n=1 Tax=Methanocella conradii TaxID=1175444 RepID=UPI00157BE66C|nr:hypothetical protein [Methanocella conradii]